MSRPLVDVLRDAGLLNGPEIEWPLTAPDPDQTIEPNTGEATMTRTAHERIAHEIRRVFGGDTNDIRCWEARGGSDLVMVRHAAWPDRIVLRATAALPVLARYEDDYAAYDEDRDQEVCEALWKMGALADSRVQDQPTDDLLPL